MLPEAVIWVFEFLPNSIVFWPPSTKIACVSSLLSTLKSAWATPNSLKITPCEFTSIARVPLALINHPSSPFNWIYVLLALFFDRIAELSDNAMSPAPATSKYLNEPDNPTILPLALIFPDDVICVFEFTFCILGVNNVSATNKKSELSVWSPLTPPKGILVCS